MSNITLNSKTPGIFPPITGESETASVLPDLSLHQIPALDGLRGIAILFVLASHWSDSVGVLNNDPPVLKAVLKVMQHGYYGVDLFFVLSGFLITRILLHTKREKNYFRNFYARRFLRIFPLYYGVLFVCLIVVEPFVGPSSALFGKLQDHWWLWLYGTNIADSMHGTFSFGSLSHFWSLAVEEHFYLVWPLVVFWLPVSTLCRTCCMLVLFAIIARAGLEFGHPMAAYLLTPCRVDGLALGALLGALYLTKGSAWITRIGPTLASCLFAAMVVLFIIAKAMGDSGNFIHHTAMCLIFGAALITSLKPGPLRILCEQPWLRMLGIYSYGLYVYHWLVFCSAAQFAPQLLALTNNRCMNVCLYVLITGLGTALLSVLSYHFYEKKFLRLKQFWQNRA